MDSSLGTGITFMADQSESVNRPKLLTWDQYQVTCFSRIIPFIIFWHVTEFSAVCCCGYQAPTIYTSRFWIECWVYYHGTASNKNIPALSDHLHRSVDAS